MILFLRMKHLSVCVCVRVHDQHVALVDARGLWIYFNVFLLFDAIFPDVHSQQSRNGKQEPYSKTTTTTTITKSLQFVALVFICFTIYSSHRWMCDRLNLRWGDVSVRLLCCDWDFGADLNLAKREVRAFMNPFEIVMNLNHFWTHMENDARDNGKKIINDDIFWVWVCVCVLYWLSLLTYLINWAYNVCFFYRDWILSDSICNRIFFFFCCCLPVRKKTKIQKMTMMVWGDCQNHLIVCGLIKFASLNISAYGISLATATTTTKEKKLQLAICTVSAHNECRSLYKKMIDRSLFTVTVLWRNFKTAIQSNAIRMWKYVNFVNLSASVTTSQGSAIQILNNN